MRLRHMLYEELGMVRDWRNAPEVRRAMYTHHEISWQEHEKWWRDRAYSQHYLIAEDPNPVGFVSLTNINKEQGTADWAFYKASNAPKGTGTRMERAAIEYAFETLKLERLSCEVLSYNKPVYYLHRKHGFQLEGTLKRAHLFEGERHDIYKLALFKGDWKDALEQTWVGRCYTEDVMFTNLDIENFAELTGDNNPIHYGPGRIAHGMLSGASISRILGSVFPGEGAIYLNQTLSFTRKVRPNDRLQIDMKVVSQVRHKLWIETIVRDPMGHIYVEGEALVLLP